MARRSPAARGRGGAGTGLGSGLMGVLIFSGSLPATRVAVADMSPLFVTSARATIAALIGAVLLLAARQARPGRADVLPLLLVAGGVVIGFPLLTGLALREITAARSVVFIGLLPLATATFGVVRGGERPKPAFWVFSALGGLIAAWFASRSGATGSTSGDLLMIAAILACGMGYAEGATLSRRLGGWQVVSWALLLSLGPMAALTWATMPAGLETISNRAWLGLAYVSVFSMLVGFIFWYRGLARGGIARVGQLQLLQPFLGMMLCALLLHESIDRSMIWSAAFVLLCVAGARKFA